MHFAGKILEVLLPAPRPDNFRHLGLSKHPPPAGRFRTKEAPIYAEGQGRERLAKTIGKALTASRGGAARNIVPRLVYRVGVPSHRGTVLFATPPAIFTRKFEQARLIAKMDRKSEKPVAAARNYIREFLEDFFESTAAEKYDTKYAYILQVGVSLQAPTGRVFKEKLSARQWAIRYNRSRREARAAETKKKGS